MKTVYRLVKRDDLPCFKMAGACRFKRSDHLDALDAGKYGSATGGRSAPAGSSRKAPCVRLGASTAGLDGDHAANAQRVCVSAQVSKFEQLSVYKKRTASVL